MTLFALATLAQARDVLHVTASHEWSQRLSRDAGQMGPSLKLDVGFGKGIGIGKIIPEVGLAYAYERQVIVPRVGVRAILGWLITPGVYAHVNGAWSGGGGPFPSPVLGFDSGASLHLQLPYIRISAFGGVQFFGGPSGADIPDRNVVGGLELVLALPVRRDEG